MRTQDVHRLNEILLASLVITAVLLPQSTGATTRTVSNLIDAGVGSLRDTIAASVAGDMIDFSVTGTITLTSGELAIARSLTIIGPASGLTVSGNNASRVFNIFSGITVNISNVTIRDGSRVGAAGSFGNPTTPGGPGADAQGGGILNLGTLNLTNCRLNNNTAVGGQGGTSNNGGSGSGGGIANQGTLKLANCTFSNNSAVGGSGGNAIPNGGQTLPGGTGGNGSGGGIANQGTLNLTNCTLNNNSVTCGRGGNSSLGGNGGNASGGGINNLVTLTSVNCTLSGNSAAGGAGGGGDFIYGGVGGAAAGGGINNLLMLTLVNCTISGNSVSGGAGATGSGVGGPATGGGLNNLSALTLVNCTLGGNSVTGGNGGNGSGGGLYQSAGSNTTSLLNTIVAGDSATAGIAGTGSPNGSAGTNAGPDAMGVMNSQGHNFIGKINDSSGWVGSDFTGSIASPLNPQLGPLQNNGGPTFTMALMPGSAAIDVGDDAVLNPPFNLTTDQRGGPRQSGAHVDIGALETDVAQAGPNFVVNTADDRDDGIAGGFDCTLREAINAANANVNANSITFAPNVTGVIWLQLGELNVSHDSIIIGPGAKVLAIGVSNNSPVIHVSGGAAAAISGLSIRNVVVGFNSFSGMYVDGVSSLSLAACHVSGFRSTGILNGGTLTLNNCTISGNSGDGGGGIANYGTLNITNSTISGNGAGHGGGIYNQGTLMLNCSTVCSNIIVGGNGGGVQNNGGAANVWNCIIAGNTTNFSGTGLDCGGSFTSLGYNLIGKTNDSSGFSGANQDQTGSIAAPIDPLLGPLADNGGPTLTHRPLAGSPVIDKGNSFGLTADQRGTARPFDFSAIANASGGDGSDIGAFELNPPVLSIARVANSVVLSWSTNAAGFRLQTVTNLAVSNNWTSASGTPSIIGSQFYLTNTASGGRTFYRLIFP